MAYRRLLEIQPMLSSIVYADEARQRDQKQLVTGDAKAKDKARKMVAIIKNQEFWFAITR
jgi:hypothetical protein